MRLKATRNFTPPRLINNFSYLWSAGATYSVQCFCNGVRIGAAGKQGSSVGGMRVVLSLVIASVLAAVAHECEQFSNDGGDYYEAISDCGACAANPRCGFCLSTLQCTERGSNEPLSGLPCNYWLTAATECPEIPQCEQLSSCGVCVDMEGCAWCASEQRCLTVSEIFLSECEGSIFDPPCPSNPV